MASHTMWWHQSWQPLPLALATIPMTLATAYDDIHNDSCIMAIGDGMQYDVCFSTHAVGYEERILTVYVYTYRVPHKKIRLIFHFGITCYLFHQAEQSFVGDILQTCGKGPEFVS